MKRSALLIVAGLVVCLAFAYSAEAQMAGKKGMMKDMGAGMMSGGMPDCACGMPQCGMGGGMMPGCGMMQGRGMMGRGMMRGEMMGRHQHMMHMCLQHLDLDAKQKQEIEGIRMATMKKVIRKRADMQIARLELRDLLSKDPVDMKAVAAKVKEIEGLRADIHLALITARVEVKSKLTPQQRQKMMDMMGGPMMESGPMMSDTDEEMEMQPPLEKQDEDQPDSGQMEQMQ
jgi:Spy/CpxP family protein refolding chaperone